MSGARDGHRAAALSPRDQYRWLLMAGWFVLFSGVFAFVIAAPVRPQAADAALVSLAMLAFVVYSLAMKRTWIAIGLFVATIAAIMLTTL